MRSLYLKAFGGLAVLFLIMASLLFVAAGTLHYWQAWLFLAVYFLASLAITLYLINNNRALLARRMSGGPFAEKEPAQRIIMALVSIGFVGLILLPTIASAGRTCPSLRSLQATRSSCSAGSEFSSSFGKTALLRRRSSPPKIKG